MSEFFKGTLLASPIVRGSSGDTYGTHHSVLGVGGYMEVKTITERNTIPPNTYTSELQLNFDDISVGQRRLGMLIHVLEDNAIYRLFPKSGDTYITLSEWNSFTTTEKLIKLCDNSNWYSLLGDSETGGSGDNISKRYYQNNHSFVKGDVIGYDGTEFIKVGSTTALTVEPLGLVSTSDWNGSSGNNSGFTLTYAGYINTNDILDYTGGTLVSGTIYYLASGETLTNGKLTEYNPTSIGEVSKPMLITTSGNTGIVLQYRGICKLEEGVTYGVFSGYSATTQVFLNKTVTGATNVGFFSGFTGTQRLSIATSYGDYSGQYYVLYNNYYRDSNGVIRIGTPDYHGTLRRGYLKTSTPIKSWVYNTYTGNSNQIGWILVDGNVETNVGCFLGAYQYAGSAYTETEWWYTGGTAYDGYYNNGGNLTIDVNGDVYTGDTYNIGGPIYLDKEYQELKLRTLVTNSPDVIKITYDENFVYVSGTTTCTVPITSTSAGVYYYYSTPIIDSKTEPVGLDSTGTLGNGVFVATLSKTPVVAGGTQNICATANGDIRAVTAWYNNSSIGRCSIDAGTWDFTSWYCVDSVVGDTRVINNMYQVVPITGSTIQVTGSSANARTATISGYEFSGEYFSASTINTNSSWLQISSDIYQICEKIDSNNVCIVVPTGYVNSGGTGNTWNILFGATSATLESTSFTCYTTSSTQTAFTVSPTDKLGGIGFLSTTGARTVTMTYNGVTQASYMKTPLITLHNDLAGLQGGTESERYHITLSEHGVLQNTTGVNTGDETKISIEGKLTGEITTHTHPYSGLTGIPNFSGLTNNFNSHTGDTTIHFTEDSININISQVSGLTDSLLLKSDTGHTHSYTGTTILNKPSFTGSGNTTVSLVGNEYRIYSTGDSVFTENILVSISAGKTFGKYENGDTIPASGKTAAQVIQMALAEALPPTVNLSSSGNNVAFGESGKTVNLSFSYTINTVGAHVETVLLEWRRGGTGSWSGLTTNTGDTTYNHTIYELNRFNTSQINYQYTVTDNQGGTYTATHNVTPTAYAIPTISPTYVGTVVSPETQSIRELGNVDTTIAGTVDSNNSLVNVTGYTTYRRINGGAYSAIITCTGLCSVSPITIASYLDSGATGTATSVGYCVSVGDEYTTSSGGACTITFRSMSYYGCNPNTTLIGSEVCGLGNAASLTTNDRTMTNVTSGVGNYTYIAFPATYGDLTSIKLGGVEEVITAWSCLSPDVSVTNGHGQSVDYIVYRSLATNAYTSATLVIV